MVQHALRSTSERATRRTAVPNESCANEWQRITSPMLPMPCRWDVTVHRRLAGPGKACYQKYCIGHATPAPARWLCDTAILLACFPGEGRVKFIQERVHFLHLNGGSAMPKAELKNGVAPTTITVEAMLEPD